MVWGCCCATEPGDSASCIGDVSVVSISVDVQKDAHREIAGGDEEAGHMAASMKNSDAPSFFPHSGVASKASANDTELPTPCGEGVSSTTHPHHGTVMTPRPMATPRTAAEKEQEKVRLQAAVNEFKLRAVSGIRVHLIDQETLDLSGHIFSMDKLLYTVSLTPENQAGSSSGTPFNMGTTFDMMDLQNIYKDSVIVRRAPKLAPCATNCLGIDFASASAEKEIKSIFFHFMDGAERDSFYTCLKILHMSATILRRETEAASGNPRIMGAS